MGKSDTKDLLRFLKAFPSDMQERALWLRDFVWGLYPTANELIYDNYNALAFGWSVTDRVGHLFCTIAVGRTSGNIHFGFYWGGFTDRPEETPHRKRKSIPIHSGEEHRCVSKSVHAEDDERGLCPVDGKGERQEPIGRG